MLIKIGYPEVKISKDAEDIKAASKLILPGVGHFDYGMRQLKSAPFFEVLHASVTQHKTPILGICLGAQLLLEGSEEGASPGLGWIPGKSVRFDENKLPVQYRVPHMGWSDVRAVKPSKLLTDLSEEARFYFVHSYHLQCAEPGDVLLTANYGIPLVAAIERENIIGVQFHPEKSHKFGMNILKNFITLY